MPMINPDSLSGKVINYSASGGEHLEQQSITKIQFQKSQIRHSKMAV